MSFDPLKSYNEGLQGVKYEPEHFHEFMASLKHPLFGDACREISGSGRGKLSMPFILVEKILSSLGIKPFTEKQTCSDCFTASSLVRTSNGKLVPIKDINIGDYVLGSTNLPRLVTDFIKKPYTGKMIRLFIDGLPDPIELTPDHKVDIYPDIESILTRTKKRKNSKYKTEREVDVKAEELQLGNYVCVSWGLQNKGIDKTIDLLEILPELKPDGLGKVQPKGYGHSINRYITIDEDFGWLYGIYLAEGGTGNAKICFSLSIKEQDLARKIERLILKIFGHTSKVYTPKHRDDILLVECYSKVLELLFKKLSYGNTYSKEIHPYIFEANYETRLSCLRGWIDGDGHLNIKERRNNSGKYYCSITGVTASKPLSRDMISLSLSCKLRPTFFQRKKSKHQRVAATEVKLYSDSVLEVYPEYKTEVLERTKIHKQHADVMTHGIARKIIKIEEFYVNNIDVYCLEVDVDHKFQVGYVKFFNCVSHGTRNAVDITRACEILMSNDNESFVTIGATEAIYGARGYSGDGGMSCSRAAQFVSETGGVLLRKKYGDIDLTKYSGSTAIRFGRGIPKELVSEGKKHQVKTVSLITTLEQLRDALANGYGVACCSGQGFSSTRDKDGFCKAQGSWAHCMCLGGFDDKSSRKGVLIINSWGAYLNGPSPEWGTLPAGGFMAELDVIQRMLNSRGTFAFSNFDGFPTQNISTLGFDSYL